MTLIMNLHNFQQKKWYVIHDQNDVDYGEGNKIVQTLSLRQKIIHQVFVIIQMRIFL